MNFALMQHHKYSLTELENMMPWEREIYISQLQNWIKEENKRIAEEEANKVVDITDDSKELSEEPVGVSASSSINITSNGNECPNSVPNSVPSSEQTTPSELMEKMVNEPIVETPSKSWADKSEE